MCSFMCKGLFLILFLNYSPRVLCQLFFPGASVLQLTSSFSAPIEIPGRKLYWDWGLQMNFDLPSKLSQFYNVPIFPWSRRHIREATTNSTKWDNGIFNMNTKRVTEDNYHKYDDVGVRNLHSNDFSAGELYRSFENLLLNYGFHETCLLRSVCELARHPFADEKRNILTEVLTFVLTPSLHDAFLIDELSYKETYEQAEQYGFMQNNCTALYKDCQTDLITAITKVIYSVK